MTKDQKSGHDYEKEMGFMHYEKVILVATE